MTSCLAIPNTLETQRGKQTNRLAQIQQIEAAAKKSHNCMTTMVICTVFLSTSSPQESQGEAYSSSLSPKKKGKGGRKKNLHPPTPTIMKHRRNMANARERKRMNGLNDAFERLREVVPNVNTEQVCSNSFNNKNSFLNLIFCRR